MVGSRRTPRRGRNSSAGAAREAREELSISIDPADLTFAHLCHHADPDSRTRIGVFFAAARWTGQPSNAEPDKCSKIDWFNLDELPDDLVTYVRAGIQAHRRGETFSLDGWTIGRHDHDR